MPKRRAELLCYEELLARGRRVRMPRFDENWTADGACLQWERRAIEGRAYSHASTPARLRRALRNIFDCSARSDLRWCRMFHATPGHSVFAPMTREARFPGAALDARACTTVRVGESNQTRGGAHGMVAAARYVKQNNLKFSTLQT